MACLTHASRAKHPDGFLRIEVWATERRTGESVSYTHLSAVCDALCAKAPVPVLKIGVQDVFGESGPAVKLLEKYGLTAAGICKSVKEWY